MEKIFDEDNKLIWQLTPDLNQTIKAVETLFQNCNDVVKKKFQLNRPSGTVGMYIIYIDGLTDSAMVERTIIKPLLWEWKNKPETDLFQDILTQEVETVDIKTVYEFDAVLGSVFKGDTAIFIDGYEKALVISSKKLPLRSIQESDSEPVMRGPRDSFNESIRMGTALIRRRIRDTKLKVVQGSLGQRSRSDYALMYMEDLAEPGLVDQIKEEMEAYDVDALYDSGMLAHLMDKKWYSPFPQIQSTERPDKTASAILEGRVAILLDNSPEALIVPATFNTFFQASDDYYNRWSVATFARILRYVAALLAIGLPGLYVAITSFHTEVLPTGLLLAIAAARSAVTFPVVVEVLLMELEFELLREAGIRLPGQMGNTIGVVGGLIVGQAAVEAGLVSTIVVIVVALTAIASFAIPNEEFISAFRLLKFFVLLASAFLGLYGFLLAMLVIAIHLAGLSSYGVPYMMPAVSGIYEQEENKDFILRLPIKTMWKRPIFTKQGQRRRIKKK